ncbi:uncharacterized protein FIBRA_09597 [Fibroporia radiculosa]|uniref:Uncharacterized protein n=1 Tax=Fibroporia radiculosa TaxID=599839 RepID=J7SCJ9_9APHY|nr:uncharacterized protein FIBRA_09597 [Fibroporia radiculosa]CCM07251.1 predicted protein [Fibroporia radiculosa]
MEFTATEAQGLQISASLTGNFCSLPATLHSLLSHPSLDGLLLPKMEPLANLEHVFEMPSIPDKVTTKKKKVVIEAQPMASGPSAVNTAAALSGKKLSCKKKKTVNESNKYVESDDNEPIEKPKCKQARPAAIGVDQPTEVIQTAKEVSLLTFVDLEQLRLETYKAQTDCLHAHIEYHRLVAEQARIQSKLQLHNSQIDMNNQQAQYYHWSAWGMFHSTSDKAGKHLFVIPADNTHTVDTCKVSGKVDDLDISLSAKWEPLYIKFPTHASAATAAVQVASLPCYFDTSYLEDGADSVPPPHTA